MCIRDRKRSLYPTGTVHSQRDRRHSPCPGKERLERCSPSARGHSQPQIHSRDNHAARAANCPACPHAPYGRCGADERGLAMVSVYPLWKADDHTGPVSYTHLYSLSRVVRPAELHSLSAEKSCMTENVASLRSVKVATPPCAAKAAIPCGLAVRKRF